MKSTAHKASEQDRAWSWMLTNLLVLPGLGSVLGGRRVGYLQAALALAGLVLSLMFVAGFVHEWWTLRQLPELTGRWLLLGAGGVALFACSWLWALLTSLLLLRDSRR